VNPSIPENPFEGVWEVKIIFVRIQRHHLVFPTTWTFALLVQRRSIRGSNCRHFNTNQGSETNGSSELLITVFFISMLSHSKKKAHTVKKFCWGACFYHQAMSDKLQLFTLTYVYGRLFFFPLK